MWDDEEAEVLFRAKLSREDNKTPWGFRLQGGADYSKPLTLLKVQDGSVAAESGLHHGDILVKLAGQSSQEMTHKAAQEAIRKSGDTLEIIVKRAEESIVSANTTGQKNNNHKHEEPAAKQEDNTPTVNQTSTKQQDESDLESAQSSVTSESSAEAAATNATASPKTKPKKSANLTNSNNSNKPDNNKKITDSPTNDAKKKEALKLTTLNIPASEEDEEGMDKPQPLPMPAGGLKPLKSIKKNTEAPKDAPIKNEVSADTSPTVVNQEKLLTTADERATRSKHKPSNSGSKTEVPNSDQKHVILDRKVAEPNRTNETSGGSLDRGDLTRLEQERADKEVADTFRATAPEPETQIIHPWRKNRQSSREGKSENSYVPEIPQPTQTEEPKPQLTLVGRRIESSCAPLTQVGAIPNCTGCDVMPHFQMCTATDSVYCTTQPGRAGEYRATGAEDIHFSTADPDLVNIPMPAVKQMVADLNRRLEAIAAQQPDIAEPPTAQELGLSFYGREGDMPTHLLLERSRNEEQEIIIDSPPYIGVDTTPGTSMKKRIFDGKSQTADYPQNIYDIMSPLSSPPPLGSIHLMHRREPGSSSSGSRRVTFAEPPEQSIIEIESRMPKPGEIPERGDQSIDWRAKARAIKESVDIAKLRPSYTIPLTMHTVHGPSGHPGISISISTKPPDHNSPDKITVPISNEPTKLSYTFSTARTTEPFSIRYSFPPTYAESVATRSKGELRPESYRHFTYPPNPQMMANDQARPVIVVKTSTGEMTYPAGYRPPGTMGEPERGNPSVRFTSPPGDSSKRFVAPNYPPSLMESRHPPRMTREEYQLAAASAPGAMSVPRYPSPPGAAGYKNEDLPDDPATRSMMEAVPGLFALFDKTFTEKFIQWNQRFGDDYQPQPSETMRLVREMDKEQEGWPPRK